MSSTLSVDNHVHDNHLHDVQYFTPRDVTERLEAAKEQCRLRGVRFTPLRQQIYALVLQTNKPVGAYDLITKLQQMRTIATAAGDKEEAQKNVAPPTVYRSLEFLLSEGLIHQLTSINAYVPCCHPRAQHTAAFLICEQCQRVQECSSLPVQEMMSFAEQDAGFIITRSVIEISGRCQACQ
ncbi:transcriptional repressor [Psychrobacter sp. P11G5]|uniref:Fur family transcriptional regulator n=1 Tax=Psychrobacter sp. P11G5 TaxID=1699624 RepID=UPI00078E2239|nr:transcriptional repressor [Psychrobacter sp. P11G5]AMN68529.1 Fur family transcriptional regulator [Psychrobacter sp. P11G5]